MVKQALALGALAYELLKPQRVRDLEAFFNQYPAAYSAVLQAMQSGVVPSPAPVLGAVPDVLSEVASEASVPGPVQGIEPNPFGPERPV